MKPILTTKDGFFCDSSANKILLRGVNLGGSTKVPYYPDGTTHFNQDRSFRNHRTISFVGRPFPESEANEHFDRLKKWGFNFLRFLVTWEAIEHKGPKMYDWDYMEYVSRLILIAEKKGFYIYIDPHQDVWSRFTGGDGAPGWTLEKIGINIENIGKTDSVLVHHFENSRYAKMIWPQNHYKYPCATMFTLFFAGNVFAPNLKIGKSNIQNYLQDHYIQSMKQLAKILSHHKNVVGFGTLNEPSPGFIGHQNLLYSQRHSFGKTVITTPFEEMYLSEGIALKAQQKFMFGESGFSLGKVKLNPQMISLWKDNSGCVWRLHGVWDYDPKGAPLLLKPNYFQEAEGKRIHFFRDCLYPFAKNYKKALQEVEKRFFIFLEGQPDKLELKWEEKNQPKHGTIVNASHWYDVALLFSKVFMSWLGVHMFEKRLVLGKKNVLESYIHSIKMIKNMSKKDMQDCPTVIGETGIPMDMNKSQAYENYDYTKHEKALDRIFQAIESNMVHVSIWNYTADNTNLLGDRWNEEDLSIYSADTPKYVDQDGGRGTRAFSRPYPRLIKGKPISYSFDYKRGVFELVLKQEVRKQVVEAEIFLPPIHYGDDFKVYVNSGSYTFDFKERVLKFKGLSYIHNYMIKIIKHE